MTSRRSRFLAALPVLALSPLLAAPRGCHFGDGDVPIGQNETGGDAGMAGEGGTTGGTGGTATGGRPGRGGASGASTGGGSGTGGASTGGASTGGGAGTGAGDGPCIETLSALTWQDDHGLEFSDEDVRTLLARNHQATLAWAHGPATVTLALLGVRVFFVESKPNPDYLLDLPVSCENHVRAVTVGRVWTSNGEIDATIPNFELNIAIPTLDGPGPAADRLEASAVETIAAANIGGNYGTLIDSNDCFHSLQLNIGIGRNDFNGEIIETLVLGPCDNPSGAVSGRSSGSWRCTDDCRTAPDVSIAVEAESCDDLGIQLTHAGDDETFTRSGDTLSRTERWGCGCARHSEFIMAWSRRSPLEVRLCHDDFADSCEAGCEAEVSHDLSTGFRTANATDYRCVD
ncbi:MAG TPA: hypothetical protein VFZ53_01175 [Polyangiaceae bacterium]